MNNKTEKRREFIINFLYFGIFVGLFVFFINYAFGYVFPFAFAAILAVTLQRPVRFISRKLRIKAHGAVSTILVLLIVLLVIGGLAIFGMVLFNELRDFLTYVFSHFSSVGDLISTVEETVMGLVMKLPGGVSDTVGGYVTDIFAKFEGGSGVADSEIDLSVLSAPLSGAWNVVKGVPSTILGIVVTIISCVFITSDYDNIKKFILGMCSEQKREKLINSKRTIVKGISKLVKAYATIMIITFSEMFLGLTFLKLIGVYNGGYIAIIAFVTCIVDIVPVLGTGTVIIPWAVYNLLVGNIGLGIGLGVLYAVITVLRQVIEPKLVANQVGLPAIITIMAMFIGAKLFGAFGIIILPLTVIILKLMYDEGIIFNKAAGDDDKAGISSGAEASSASDELSCEEG